MKNTTQANIDIGTEEWHQEQRKSFKSKLDINPEEGLNDIEIYENYLKQNNLAKKLRLVQQDKCEFLIRKKEYKQGIVILKEHLPIVLNEKDDGELSNIYNLLARLYPNNLNKQIDYFSKAIEHGKRAGNKETVAVDMVNLATLKSTNMGYVSQQTIELYKEAIEILKKLNTKNIVPVYYNLFVNYGNLNDTENQLKAYKEAKFYAHKFKHKGIASVLEIFEVEQLCDKGKYDKAIKRANEILPKLQEQKLTSYIAKTNHFIGMAYRKLEKYETAITFYLAAKNDVLITNKFLSINPNIELIKCYEALGDKDNVIAILKENLQLNEEKFKKETVGSINELQAKYETERKDKENLELRLKALRAQMNPHFIFNSLNSIQNFVVKNNNQEAIQFISKFANLMRQTLTNSEENNISLEDEIDFLNNYLSLEKLRFKSTFDFKITVDEEIDETFIFIPSMLIQPYVENAIVHGMKGKKEKGRIEVLFNLSHNEEKIICHVIDNGNGISAIKNENKKHKSLGTKITKDRISNLANGQEVQVKYFDLKTEENSGTKVAIEIPIVDA